MSDTKSGLVYRSTGSWYEVKDDYGRMWHARIKGKLKIDKDISSTNPIAVGDTVFFDVEDELVGNGVVKRIADRRNYMVRVSPHNPNQKHIIAANLDLAIVIASIAEPRTSAGFIDRFLVTAEAYHIPAIVVVNKIDQLDGKGQQILAEWQHTYQLAGYPLLTVVALDRDSLTGLINALTHKCTLFSGHSGVGKSTLINSLVPGMDLRTNIVSGWSGKGQHTTTFAEMYDLPFGGAIIDTPGVKEFGLIDMERSELSHYFPEMRNRLSECRFNNCQHVNEPGCAIIDAVEAGTIAQTRYQSYLNILGSLIKVW